MWKVKSSIFFIVFCISLFLSPVLSEAATNGQILLEGKLDIEESDAFRIPLTNMPIELRGPEQEKNFFYEIKSKPTSDNNQVVLNIVHSELLISPSSITIYVDDEPIISKAIHNEQSTMQIVVPLTGEALEEGFHSVRLAFSGIIKEGICVTQESSGNWLSIGIDSYFQISGQKQQEQRTLSDYPSRFIGTEKRPVVILLPDHPSLETLDSGLKVAAYLANQTDDEKAVQVVRESTIEKIIGDVIVVGGQSEFKTPFMNELFHQAALPVEDEALSLSRYVLIDGEQQAEALFITAKSPQAIEERISILLKDDLARQLSGQQMTIQTIPEFGQNETERVVPLKKMGIPTMTLNRVETSSELFFYYAPVAIQPDGKTTLELHLKRSATITSYEEGKESVENLLDNDVELTVLVNNIPHSIDMRALMEEKNDVYKVQIPIDAKSTNENRLISLQFQSSGLGKKNPCIETDENHWIYIADDSFFMFPEDQEGEYTLAKFPTPFADQSHEVLVILPNDMDIDDGQLLSLYESIFVTGQTPQWKLKRSGDLTETDLKDRHLVFLGGPNIQQLLQNKQSDLIIAYDEGRPNLAGFGFLQEAVEKVSWIQSSPWNSQQVMLVFDQLGQSSTYIDQELLGFLKQTDEVATIAVKMNNKQIYTNASQLGLNGQQESRDQLINEKSTFSVWTILGFAALILFTVVLIYFVLRKQKRREE